MMSKPEVRKKISDGMRKAHKEGPKKKEKPKEKVEKQILPVKKDTLGFHMGETREHLIAFPIKDIVPDIIFDFERNSIRIELDGAFSITSGNWEREAMKDLAKVLNRDYHPEKRQRLDVAKKLKSVSKSNREAVISRFFSSILGDQDE